ncbi:universal stress protein [Kriegella aquimaris]|uniref:Nucleotide-binding universal stress protein, UspA family n=1 Tax=Kriegella aquimaris TaxID=192904 RepID=A0A1G9RZM1_9FLAO|nr:universal stress protein [Kriegella aquimaris]SDM28738.1 Nucleotide-binding universal stress protein, UspA family [Kriegella aquimaris]
MEKRILLPTDFSKNALNAIRYALALYADQQCDFYFLNVYQVDGYNLDNAMMVPEPGESAFEAAKSKSEHRFKELMEILNLNPKNPKHTYHTISTFSFLFEAVENTIARHDIDIIVMGTKGRTGSHTVIYGTNTINLMEEVTECPVLAIPEDVRFAPPKEIVFPTDYKTPFKRRELNYLIEIGKMYGTAIRILHVKEKEKLSQAQENNKELLEDILKNTSHSFHSLEGVKVHTGINAFIESRNSDMVAFLNKKHRFFGSMWSNPLVKELGYHSRVPVFTLNDHS